MHFTAGNVLLIYLYGKDVGPWMQTMHFVFAVGGKFTPVFAIETMVVSFSVISCGNRVPQLLNV